MNLAGNTIFEGAVKLYPEASDTANYYTLDNTESVAFADVDDYVTKYEELNTSLAAGEGFVPTGTGPITALFELDDVIYVGRTNTGGTGTKLWRTTDLSEPASDIQYEAVDMGYQVGFDAGAVEPYTVYDLDFLSVADPSPAIENRFARSGRTATTINSANKGYEWGNLSNVTFDDSNDTEVAFASSPNTSTGLLHAPTLILTGFTDKNDGNKTAAIEGITCEVRHAYSHLSGLTSLTAPYGKITSAKLVNVGGSDNKAPATQFTMTKTATGASDSFWESDFTTTTIGGVSDTWNGVDVTSTTVFNDNFGVELEFAVNVASADSTAPNRRDIFVSWVKITVSFTDGTERVYFWNGSTDVAEADVVHINVEDGEWEKGDAEGTFYLYDVTTPANIVDNLDIRSAASGGGSLIALTDGAASEQMLPTWEEMEAEGSRTQTLKANFFIDEDREAVYGVTGAGPAFTFDGTYFREIRAPVPLSQDKPRHIAEHQNHLVLGFRSGSIILSVVGQPTNFSGVEGASEFGFGDVVTGLVGLSGNALGVLCEQSTHALIGTSLSNFTTQIISKSTGAIEYSVVNMGRPIYADFRGISTIDATSNYGDFNWGRFSGAILPWLQPRLQERSREYASIKTIVASMPSRNKNQYRLFFNDGAIMTMTLAGIQGDQPMFTFQNYGFNAESEDSLHREYVPTATLSTVLSNGSELNMIGNEEGHVYILEQGPGITTGDRVVPYDAFIIFNPFFGEAPFNNTKYGEVMVHLKSSGFEVMTAKAGVNFLEPTDAETVETFQVGSGSVAMDFDQHYERISAHLPNITDGFSLEIGTIAKTVPAMNIQALTYKGTMLGDRNSSPKQY